MNAQGKTIKTGDEIVNMEHRGGVSAATVMQVPLEDAAHSLPNIPLQRRIRLNPVTNKFEGHTGTEWVELAMDKKYVDNLNALKANLIDGKIPLNEIPDALVGAVIYQGTYNPVSNTPVLPAATANKGKYYKISAAGTQQGLTFAIGDWIISSGSAWEKLTQTFPVDTSIVTGSNNAVSSNAVAIALASKENTFTKNTAFNKPFGTNADQVAEGNDTRINNGQTAFAWGSHSGLYPSVTGVGATGTWPVSISGNAATSSNSVHAELWNGLSRTAGNIPAPAYYVTMDPSGNVAGHTQRTDVIADLGINNKANDNSTVSRKNELGEKIDLNKVVLTGFYTQNLNSAAKSGTNYPATVAGKLEVQAHAKLNVLYQTYHTYQGDNQMYFRACYNDVWSDWKKVANSIDLSDKANLMGDNAFNGNQSVEGNVAINGNNRGYYLGNAGNNASIIYNANGNLDITPGAGSNTSLVRGNVLIGTTNDTGEKLQVEGAAKFTGQLTIPDGRASTSAVNKGQLDALGNSYLPKNILSGTPAAVYYTTPEISTAGIKVRLPFNTDSHEMVVFTLRVYQGYLAYDIQFSGYLYLTGNQWYMPNAIGMTMLFPIDVRMGRDTDGRAYVWIPGNNYAGAAVINVVGGFKAADWNSGWEIVRSNDTPNLALDTTVYPTVNTGNYNSYSPTLTGGGASGLWDININGTAKNTTAVGGYPYVDAFSPSDTTYLMVRDKAGNWRPGTVVQVKKTLGIDVKASLLDGNIFVGNQIIDQGKVLIGISKDTGHKLQVDGTGLFTDNITIPRGSSEEHAVNLGQLKEVTDLEIWEPSLEFPLRAYEDYGIITLYKQNKIISIQGTFTSPEQGKGLETGSIIFHFENEWVPSIPLMITAFTATGATVLLKVNTSRSSETGKANIIVAQTVLSDYRWISFNTSYIIN